jgi:hypothetical protein
MSRLNRIFGEQTDFSTHAHDSRSANVLRGGSILLTFRSVYRRMLLSLVQNAVIKSSPSFDEVLRETGRLGLPLLESGLVY